MEEIKKFKGECKYYGTGFHKFVYDGEDSLHGASSFVCICGESVIEYEDCGTGA